MGLLTGTKGMLARSSIAKYAGAIRATPREILCSPVLIFTAFIFAMCGLPQTWDQGTSATVPSLKGFQDHFGLDSGADADQISNFVSIIYVGYTIGAAGSYLFNNRLGRLWSYRLYASIWILGQIIAVFAPNLGALYAARIIAGAGIGSITVIGPIMLVEISPAEIRGLITSWYPLTVSGALSVSNFTVYGIMRHVPAGRLQYQIAWFAPCIYMALCIVATFFMDESPRWLLLEGRREEAIRVFGRLRRLPASHPRVRAEIQEAEEDIAKACINGRPSFKSMCKEIFTKKTNLRRLQQILVSYALAQLSGANSITSYFVPVMKMVGQASDKPEERVFVSGMYGFSKLCFTIIASFLFIEAFGRRKSLLVGVTCQMVTHIWIGVFIKSNQEGSVSNAFSQSAIAALFIHAFGYAVGLLVLPYVFGSELWPNHIRSLGTVIGAVFHWIFIYALKFSIPSLLEATDNWGAFIFFGAWCFLAWLYVFFMVPEVAGMTGQQIEELFKGPWFKAYRQKPDDEVTLSCEEFDGAKKI